MRGYHGLLELPLIPARRASDDRALPPDHEEVARTEPPGALGAREVLGRVYKTDARKVLPADSIGPSITLRGLKYYFIHRLKYADFYLC